MSAPPGIATQNSECLFIGESIYGTTYGPIQGVPSIRVTAKKEKIFLHVFEWPSSPLEIDGLKPKVLSAYLLASGQPLKVRQSEGKLQIDTPSQAPDPNVSVIALRICNAAVFFHDRKHCAGLLDRL